MKVSNTGPQHLANREVLDHFLALKQDNDHLSQAIELKKARDKAQAKKQYPIEKDKEYAHEEDPTLFNPISPEKELEMNIAERRGLSDELVWVQDEVIRYLCSDYVPTSRQTREGVAQLANELQDHDLTKAEILQLVNLAPAEPVTLYSIIEEADTRFYPDPAAKLEDIGNQIYDTLLPSPPPELVQYTSAAAASGEEETRYEAGHVDADTEMDEMAFMADQEYVFETGREGGIDEEKETDMD